MSLIFQRRLIAAVALLAGGGACAEISFNDDIRPILSNTCFACHGPDEAERKADLRLDTREGALADNDGIQAIVPGDLEASELIYRITTDDEDDLMPPSKFGKPLTTEQIATVKQWVAEGAPYERHWAYTKPVRPEVPVTKIKEWSRNPVDAFLLQRLEEEGLRPSEEADRHVLARRVALDLTGLPLTAEEADVFARDDDPRAYEMLVDELLSRPSFGEHWARMWLDLARYADSAGYADDPSREIWAYRDYVIRAFNENKPFDRFTIEQLAGDLLPDPTEEQLVATAFHRNTQTNNEGGTSDEEYRNVAVVDRVNTTGQVWLGTTLACAQCHTHKYDPITQEEYFEMFAILNNTEDNDKRNEQPVLELYTDEQLAEREALEAEIAGLEAKVAEPDAESMARMESWLQGEARREIPWTTVTPESVQAESGLAMKMQEDGSILVTENNNAEVDVFTITARVPLEGMTAVRLEALPDESLGSMGPGIRGNFVVNEFEVTLRPDGVVDVPGRYVRLELPGKKKFLHVAEVEVFSGEENVAREGKATQSSTDFNGPPELAIDGNTNGKFNDSRSVTHTKKEKNPWWEVDLGGEKDLTRIVVWNRTDEDTRERLDGFKIVVLDAERKVVWERSYAKAPEREVIAEPDGARTVVLQNASASFAQKKFTAADAIDGDASAESGWAIAPKTGAAHEAVFELAEPTAGASGTLTFSLRQSHPHHPLGRFRLSVTDADQPVRVLPTDIRGLVDRDERSADETMRLAKFFSTIDPVHLEMLATIAAKKKELAGVKPRTTVPVMRELAGENRRKTHIQLRGSFLDKDKEVGPGVPEDLHAWPEGVTRDRLGLAKWLLDPEHPLTARVIVNRFWEKIFGIGLVATSEEFGSQGEPPSHPELLDWLAVEFVESGWDMKAMLRTLVTTAAYRQSSRASEELVGRDPANRLLARGPAFRLSAEMVRDQSLHAAGLLSEKMFGPPVNPPQPDLGVRAAFGGEIDWKTSAGEDRYRRGIYTRWRRSNPYPSMVAFDAPNREVCTVRRDRTNTPLQAFVTLNDPVYVEAAQGLARRMAAGGETAAAKVRTGFRRCLGRDPDAAEETRLVDLYEAALADYKEMPEEAEKFATDPIGPVPEGSDHAELAALTLVGNVLLNLDEMLMKR